MVEGAAQRRAPAFALDVTATAHGGVPFGHGQKLEPDALRLKRPRQELGWKARDIGAAGKDRFDLGLMPAHHLDQELEQEVGRAFGRGPADNSLMRLGLAGRRLQLLVHRNRWGSQARRSAGDIELAGRGDRARRKNSAPQTPRSIRRTGRSRQLLTRKRSPGVLTGRPGPPRPSSRTRSDWAQP